MRSDPGPILYSTGYCLGLMVTELHSNNNNIIAEDALGVE